MANIKLKQVDKLPQGVQGIVVWNYNGQVWSDTVKSEDHKLYYFNSECETWNPLYFCDITELTFYIVDEEVN